MGLFLKQVLSKGIRIVKSMTDRSSFVFNDIALCTEMTKITWIEDIVVAFIQQLYYAVVRGLVVERMKHNAQSKFQHDVIALTFEDGSGKK